MARRKPILRLSLDSEIIVDSFAGGGGASTGIRQALGREPDIAINHDPEAIALHKANHPGTKHYVSDVWEVDPCAVTGKSKVGLMWLSPDCKHFSKAKGGKPVSKKIRGLAWLAVRWAKAKKPRVIILENVEEFQDWGPVLDDGQPCPMRKGITFRRFVRQLENLGYRVEHELMRACDYGAPTTRRRLFLVARCDGLPIVWPEPTHGTLLNPYRTAAECIDFGLPCPSIFDRSRPLAENTLRRIARGIEKYVIGSADPFIVPVMHGPEARVWPIDEPMRTITAAHRGDRALVTPYLVGIDNKSNGGRDAWNGRDPLRTITTENRFAVVAPTLIQTGYGERPGQAPRSLDLHAPLGTIVAGGAKHALVAAFLAKHNAGHEATGQMLHDPCHAITARDSKALVTSNIVKLKGTCRDGQRIDVPLHTIQAGGNHYGEVRAFLMKYHRDGGQLARLSDPMPTVVATDSLALVTVRGEQYAIVDIGMRMLQPRELFTAQGFDGGYQIDIEHNGKPLSKEAQVRMCGNSVSPDPAEALVAANFGRREWQERRLIA